MARSMSTKVARWRAHNVRDKKRDMLEEQVMSYRVKTDGTRRCTLNEHYDLHIKVITYRCCSSFSHRRTRTGTTASSLGCMGTGRDTIGSISNPTFMLGSGKSVRLEKGSRVRSQRATSANCCPGLCTIIANADRLDIWTLQERPERTTDLRVLLHVDRRRSGLGGRARGLMRFRASVENVPTFFRASLSNFTL